MRLASFLAATLIILAHTVLPAADPSVVSEIRKLGGTVRPVAADRSELEVAFHISGRELTDDGLALVAQLENVMTLNLKGTKVTSAGLAHVAGMKSLQLLHLEQTAIDDSAAVHLTGLTKLTYLNLYGTAITDKTLGQLGKLKDLQRLYLWQTAVTDAGVAGLKKGLPNLKVSLGVDLASLPASEPTPPQPPPKPIKWIATTNSNDAPRSRNGENIEVVFENKSKRRVKIYWVGYDGKLKIYGELDPGKTRNQNTYANNTWLITDVEDKPLGYFICGPVHCLAVIPAAE